MTSQPGVVIPPPTPRDQRRPSCAGGREPYLPSSPWAHVGAEAPDPEDPTTRVDERCAGSSIPGLTVETHHLVGVPPEPGRAAHEVPGRDPCGGPWPDHTRALAVQPKSFERTSTDRNRAVVRRSPTVSGSMGL